MTFNFKEVIDTLFLVGGVGLIVAGIHTETLLVGMIGGALLGAWNGCRLAGQ